MPQDQQGVLLHVVRRAVHQHDGKSRTYGTYSLVVEGQEALSGFVCEAHGPDDNADENCGKRIEPGNYPLCTHYHSYWSTGYNPTGKKPLPGIAIGDYGTVGARTGVLVHPAHEWGLGPYLSSVGCINLTGPIDETQNMDPKDSFRRVVAVIDQLRAHSPGAFVQGDPRYINGARIVIENNLHP